MSSLEYKNGFHVNEFLHRTVRVGLGNRVRGKKSSEVNRYVKKCRDDSTTKDGEKYPGF